MLMAAVTILGALLERQRTGQGRRLQVAMQDAMIHYMRTCFATRRAPPTRRRAGAKSPSLTPQSVDLGLREGVSEPS
jgi:crotonobetainyl-CoA:carnitine CoA-transferase CaiB-like acyl-CoA transferase